jgi:CheY-like chemotaxis protein
VLVVEDERDIRDLICLLLEAHGYRALGAGDGGEALAHLRANPPPAVILLDLMMPGLSGEELMGLLAKDPALGGVPVVVLSGSQTAAQRATALSAAGCLTKPVGLKALLGTIRRFIQD